MTNKHTMNNLQKEIKNFVAQREWQQFHSPKNLAMALTVEASELQEIFQWLTDKESYITEKSKVEHIEEEIGDVMIYLTTLAMKFDIDPLMAATKKLEKNKEKYPVEKARGNSLKYKDF